MLSLKIKQVKIHFIVFISLIAIFTTSCSENENFSFESMDDKVNPGSRPKSTVESDTVIVTADVKFN